MRAWLAICVTVLFLSACAKSQVASDSRWDYLFDGTSLDGWRVINGDHPFLVEGGEITGKTALGIPTRYLATEQQYDDFILELEMNNADGENSGIQFRSIQAPQFRAGLTGYQMEVDPSPRAWTGGIFFEGLGQWRHPPITNPECVSAWRQSDWNTLRIEARGPTLRTFVNAQPCAYLFDATMKSGHIALQIHSLGKHMKREGAKTRWRNIRIIKNPQDIDFAKADYDLPSVSYLVDQLSAHEDANDWQLLRPGKTGKHGWLSANIPNPVINQQTGAKILRVSATENSRRLPLPITGENFEIIANVQMAPGTKGAIEYPVFVPSPGNGISVCLASFAILDDRDENYKKISPDLKIGSAIGKFSAKNLSEANRKKRTLPADSWQRIGIRIRGSRVQHWLNAVKVAEFEGCETVDHTKTAHRGITIKVQTGHLNLNTIKYRP